GWPARSTRSSLRSGELLGLRLVVLLDGALQQLPGDARGLLDERPELPERHAEGLELRGGGDGCGAGALRDERDLAEVVAGPEHAALLAPYGHLRLSVLDHEEADSALTFDRDLLIGVEGSLLHRIRDVLELSPVEVREERNLLQKV